MKFYSKKSILRIFSEVLESELSEKSKQKKEKKDQPKQVNNKRKTTPGAEEVVKTKISKQTNDEPDANVSKTQALEARTPHDMSDEEAAEDSDDEIDKDDDASADSDNDEEVRIMFSNTENSNLRHVEKFFTTCPRLEFPQHCHHSIMHGCPKHLHETCHCPEKNFTDLECCGCGIIAPQNQLCSSGLVACKSRLEYYHQCEICSI